MAPSAPNTATDDAPAKAAGASGKASSRKPRVTLSDLTDEDRRALREELRDDLSRNPTDVEGYDELSDREKGIRALMDARDHLRGCPVSTGERLGRVEAYDARKPANPAKAEPERTLGVVRCIECGGGSVLDESVEEALKRVEL